MNMTFTSHPSPRRCGRDGFTVIELLVVCAILSLLFGLLLPAISNSREAARRLDCIHRLHQVGLGLHSHHDAHAAMPAGWTVDPTGESCFGWFVQLLPFIENDALYRSANFAQPLDDDANANIRNVSLSLAICPSDVEEQLFALYQEIGEHEQGGQRSQTVLLWLASANYLGVFGAMDPDNVPGTTGNGAFIETRAIRFAELVRGLSDTLLVSERTASKLPSAWVGFSKVGEDGASRVVGFAGAGPNRENSDESEFSSRHPGCTNFLWADGHVAAIVDSVDAVTYRRLSTRGQID